MSNPEVFPQARIIGRGINDWLKEEYRTSNENYLDGQVALGSLSLPFDDLNNLYVNKWRSHQSRQVGWAELVRMDPEYEVNHARILFNILMATSGGFKRIAGLQANNQEEYLKIKNNPDATGTGVNTVKVVAKSIEGMLEFGTREGSDHIETALSVVEHAFTYAGTTFEQLAEVMVEDEGNKISKAVQQLQQSQKKWIDAATVWIAASCDALGVEINKVPCLSPISITNQPLDDEFFPIPVYPFGRVA